MDGPCCVVGCKARDRQGVTNRHALPKDEGTRAVWLQRIGLSQWDTHKSPRVCGRHFSPDDYCYNPEFVRRTGVIVKKLRLKPRALPTLFLPTTKEPLRNCTCSAIRNTVGTQITEQWPDVPSTPLRRSSATQVNFSIKPLVAARTQTEPPAMLPAPLSPIPASFRAQGASTPQKQEAASVVSETVDSFDWDGGEQPAAELDTTYMSSFDTSVGSNLMVTVR
ncbi:hypothetical protein V5799_019396 [Amblyomma americanum]|uniref:THAP-type domain-containing protein n=1 Tax=Amblyomma americanum TaxID=6943 RepID=A0AAQ4EXD5_AMBAM